MLSVASRWVLTSDFEKKILMFCLCFQDKVIQCRVFFKVNCKYFYLDIPIHATCSKARENQVDISVMCNVSTTSYHHPSKQLLVMPLTCLLVGSRACLLFANCWLHLGSWVLAAWSRLIDMLLPAWKDVRASGKQLPEGTNWPVCLIHSCCWSCLAVTWCCYLAGCSVALSRDW